MDKETQKNIKEKFARFKSGFWGRLIDITLGIILLFLGISSYLRSGSLSIMIFIMFIVGILAFTAGVFNVCWAAPVIGIPFRGRDRKRHKK